MGRIKGVWLLNENPDPPQISGDVRNEFALNFQSDGVRYSSIALESSESKRSLRVEYDQSYAYETGGAWVSELARLLIVDKEQVINDDLDNWIIHNAQPVTAFLTYRGKILVALANNEFVTIHTKDKVMQGDLRIDVIVPAVEELPKAYEPGLYDADDNMIATWSALTNPKPVGYGMNVSGTYVPGEPDWDDRKEGHPASILTENAGLRSGTKIIIPGTVRHIGDSAFEGCNLTDVVILDGVTSVGEQAFQYSKLKSVTIPGSTKNIQYGAFKGCNNLSSVALSEGLITISDSAFMDCTELRSIALPLGLKTIANEAFSSCPIDNIAFPNGLETIGEKAFFGSHATRVRIPGSVKLIGDGAFVNQYLQDIIVEKENENYKDEIFIGEDGEEHHVLFDCLGQKLVQFPGGYKGSFDIPLGVVNIAKFAFGLSLVTDVTIPDSLENIEAFAFDGCINLNLLHIPKTIVTIGMYAFRDCASLCGKYDNEQGQYVFEILADKMETISEGMFLGCSALVNVRIEEGVAKIGGEAFARCGNLTGLEIPSTMKEIGEDMITIVNGGLEIIFNGTKELFALIDITMQAADWIDKIVFWDD